MRFTVDASVVIKWSVPEELAANARLLRAHRLELHAPDLLLAECANVFLTKHRRREIPDVRRHLDETRTLPREITLHPLVKLVARAGSMALELNHALYDCLYLACAEDTKSPLVTADRRLSNKMKNSSLDIAVRYVGAEDFRQEIETASTAPVITRATLEALLEAFRLLSATEEDIGPPDEGTAELPEPADIQMYFDSPAYRRAAALLRALSGEERIDVLALGLFGRFEKWDWRACHEQASREVDTIHESALLQDGQYWRRGYERLLDASP